jgi:hypothetical protein
MQIKTKVLVPSLSFIMFLLTPLTAAADGAFQASDVHLFGTDTPIAGAATLTRDDDSLHVRGALSGIEKKAVYSVWWVIFNNPAGCSGGGDGVCAPSDVFPGGPADVAVRNASGFITGTDGTGYFVGELDEGTVPAGLVAGFGQLNDAMGAEVHLVIQSHGTAVPGTVAFEMTFPTGVDLYAVLFMPPAP